MAPTIQPKKVSFPSGDGYVLADLYLPANHDASKKYPAVVTGGPFNTVKEQVGGAYAAQMAQRGIIGLSVDYRNYGESSGAKRQYEDPESKAEDLSSGLKFLAARPDVSGTGLLGVCTTGGNVLYTAAKDSRVGAVATVAGFFMEPAIVPMLMGGSEGVDRHKEAGRKARENFEKTGEIEIVPAYHETDSTAVNVGPAPYYLDESRGGGVRAWRNAFAVMAYEDWISFDPVSKAAGVSAPTLIVHSENAAFPDLARKVEGLLKGKKEIRWLEGGPLTFMMMLRQ